HNDVLSAPRELVAAVGTPVEMSRSGKQTFCCGAGGAHMWMEERGRGINEERVREAAETGADTLAVACPFCTVMLDDGVRASGKHASRGFCAECGSCLFWDAPGRDSISIGAGSLDDPAGLEILDHIYVPT